MKRHITAIASRRENGKIERKYIEHTDSRDNLEGEGIPRLRDRAVMGATYLYLKQHPGATATAWEYTI